MCLLFACDKSHLGLRYTQMFTFGEFMKNIFLLLMPLGVMSMGCSTFGSKPNAEKIEEYKSSQNFDATEEKFHNRRPKLVEEMYKRNMSFGAVAKFLFTNVENARPPKLMPETKPDLEQFKNNTDKFKAIWLGHTTLLLNIEGTTVLVDPVFSGSASPVSFTTKRFQKTPLSLNELPQIDVVLISHDHYDHLDMDSIRFFKDKKTKFVTPLGVGSHIESWGVPNDRIVERDWWQDYQFNNIKFTATPAQHFSGRGLFDRNRTLWASWVIKSENYNAYFSGDSGYDSHFADIGEKFGPFDIAFMETGQYSEKWPEVHMLPAQAVKAFNELKAKKYFPVHWGMFVLSEHTWNDPMKDLYQEAAKENVEILNPILGEIIDLDEPNQSQKWWNF